MAFVQMLGTLVRDKAIGKHIVPIVGPDEIADVRHGRACSASSASTRRSASFLQAAGCRPAHVLPPKTSRARCCQEGINEAGAMSLMDRRGDVVQPPTMFPMIPFYIYYSMFGLQRVGDLAWPRRRYARARVPVGRHGGAYNAERRGTAARGRP